MAASVCRGLSTWQVPSSISSLNSYRNPSRPITWYHPYCTDGETEDERSHLSKFIPLLQGAVSFRKLEDSAIEAQAPSFWVLPPAGF